MSTNEQPKKIGAITLESILGQGGHAVVYSGTHSVTGSAVAVKILNPPPKEENGPRFEDFFQEVQAAAVLNHPRITSIYDYGFVNSQDIPPEPYLMNMPWLSMELVQGGTLSDLVGMLSWEEIKRILLDILEALGHAHARRLIHRDIKPRNVLYDRYSKRIKLTDFGLGRSMEFGKDSPTMEKSISGTPAYMAPEQIRKDSLAFGPWTDLYALGCLGWKLVCGKTPYRGKLLDVLRAHLDAELPSFSPRIEVPKALQEWLRKLLQKDPNDRYQHTASARHELSLLSNSRKIYQIVQNDQRPRWEEEKTVQSTMISLPDSSEEDRTALYSESLALGETNKDQLLEMYHPSDLTPMSTQIFWRVQDRPILSIAGFSSSRFISPPFPESWRQSKESRVSLHRAGLGLFHLKSRPFVGRLPQRDQLWRILKEVHDEARQQAVVLEGTTGIGKTELARWLGYRADELGIAQWLFVPLSAVPEDVSRLGIALGASLRILNLSRAQALQRTRAILHSLGNKGLGDEEALVQFSKGIAVEPLKKELNRNEREALICRYLFGLARAHPLVLILDDCHHAPEMFSLIERILNHEQDAPIVLVITLSTDEIGGDSALEQQITDIYRREDVTKIYLSPLKSAEQILLIRGLLELDIEVASRIEQKCAGNPQYAVQLVSDWVDRGVLVAAENGFVVKENVLLEIPSSMMDIWKQRYDNLRSHFQNEDIFCLEIAAVLGHDVNPQEWRLLLNAAGVERCKRLMTMLQRNRLILAHSDSGRWSFVHTLFREVVLLQAREEGRFQKWSALASSIPESNLNNIARRARFLIDSGNPEEALKPLCEAVLLEIGRFEPGNARRLAALRDKILSMISIDPEGSYALDSAVIALFLQPLGTQDRLLREKGQFLMDWAKRLKEWELLIRLKKGKAICRAFRGAKKESIVLLKECLALAQEHQSKDIVVILNRLSLFSGDNFQQSTGYAWEAISAGKKMGSLAKIGNGYLHLTIAHKRHGQLEKALLYLEEARKNFSQVQYRAGMTSIFHQRGEILKEMGDLFGAEQAYLEAIERRQIAGELEFNLLADKLNLSVTYVLMDRFSEAQEILQAILTSLTRLSRDAFPKIALLLVFLCLAPCYAKNSQWSELEKILPQIDQDLQTFQFQDKDVEVVLRLCAQLCLEAGREDIARQVWAILKRQFLRLGQPEKQAEMERLLQ